MKLRLILYLLVAVVSLEVGLHAILGQKSIGTLARQSDVIVVGDWSLEGQDGRSLNGTISVDRVIKGKLVHPGDTVQVSYAIDLPATMLEGAVGGHVYGLWFLVSDHSSGYRVLAPLTGWGMLPGEFSLDVPHRPLPAAWAYPEDASVSQKLAMEIGAIAEAHKGYGPESDIGYQNLFDGLDAPWPLEVFQRFSASPDLDLRLRGWAGRLRLSDPTVPAEILAALPEIAHARSPLMHTERGDVHIFHGNATESPLVASLVRSMHSYESPDLQGIRALETLVRKGGEVPGLSVQAARTLMEIHTLDTLPFFAELLDSTDPALRGAAVNAFGLFANGYRIGFPDLPHAPLILTPQERMLRNGPGVDTHFVVGANPDRLDPSYAAFWKQWWSEHRAALLGLERPAIEPDPEQMVMQSLLSAQAQMAGQIARVRSTDPARAARMSHSIQRRLHISSAGYDTFVEVAQQTSAQLQQVLSEQRSYLTGQQLAHGHPDPAAMKAFADRRASILESSRTALQQSLSPADWEALQSFFDQEKALYRRGHPPQ